MGGCFLFSGLLELNKWNATKGYDVTPPLQSGLREPVRTRNDVGVTFLKKVSRQTTRAKRLSGKGDASELHPIVEKGIRRAHAATVLFLSLKGRQLADNCAMWGGTSLIRSPFDACLHRPLCMVGGYRHCFL